MVHFYAKIGGFGTSNVFIFILLIKSFHLVPNLPLKSVVLSLFDKKIGPKK